MTYYLNSAPGLSLASISEAVVLELIVIAIMAYTIKKLVQSMKFSRMIKMLLNENYTLYQFTKTEQDKASKERLILSTINEIRRLQPSTNYFLLNYRVAFEITAFTAPLPIRLVLFCVKLLRVAAIVILIGLIFIFISIISTNVKNLTAVADVLQVIAFS